MTFKWLLLAFIAVAAAFGADGVLLEYTSTDGTVEYISPPQSYLRMTSMFPLTRDQKARAPNLAGIRLDLFLDPGGIPKAEASVMFGSFKDVKVDTPQLPRETFGVYTVPLAIGQSVVIEAPERYRLEPMVLRVVSAKPDAPRSPEVLNRTQSLSVAAFEEYRNRYVLTLQNTSPRPVIALTIGRSLSEPWLSEFAAPLTALMGPGASHEIGLPFSPSAEPVRQLVILAVIFADRGWEGHPEAAVAILAPVQAHHDTELRIASLIDSVIGSMDGRSAESLVAGIKAIPEIDEPAVQTVLAACGLPETARQAVEKAYRRGVRDVKASTLLTIENWRKDVPTGARLRKLRESVARQ